MTARLPSAQAQTVQLTNIYMYGIVRTPSIRQDLGGQTTAGFLSVPRVCAQAGLEYGLSHMFRRVQSCGKRGGMKGIVVHDHHTSSRTDDLPRPTCQSPVGKIHGYEARNVSSFANTAQQWREPHRPLASAVFHSTLAHHDPRFQLPSPDSATQQRLHKRTVSTEVLTRKGEKLRMTG